MYLVKLSCQNARLNLNGQFAVALRGGSIPKWTIFSAERRTLELFHLRWLEPENGEKTAHPDLYGIITRIPIGTTEGYSLVAEYKKYASPKSILVYPLCPDFREKLSSGG